MMPLLRLMGFIIWAMIIAPIQLTAVRLNLHALLTVPICFHKVVLWMFGIQVQTTGTLSPERPTLFVANHISYLDIFVCGSVIEGSFVAKAEIAEWPIVGMFARMQRTIFVNRDRRAQAGEQRDRMQKRFEAGDNLILFPEGTSHDGARVLEFKSTLFAAAQIKVDDKPITVQPISIAYTEMDGLPLTRAHRPLVAWYGDMSLLPHIWAFLKAQRTLVQITYHPPVTMEGYANRRELAKACHEMVSSGVTHMIMGRDEALQALPAPTPDAEPIDVAKQSVANP